MESEESRGELGILLVELSGELVGIDLNKYGITSPDSPPNAPIRYRLDLRNNGFPIGMCPIKTNNDHKLYLLGGTIFDPNQQWIDPIGHKGWVNYSDQVFEFDPSFLMEEDIDIPIIPAKKVLKTFSSFIRDMDRDKEVIVPAKKVLKTVPNTMMGPKFALVANLKGTFYVMNHWIYGIIPCFKPRVPFERFDSNDRTWHEAPTPPLFYGCCSTKSPVPDDNSGYVYEFGNINDYGSEFWNRWPDEGGHIFDFPVYSYFVVDDKFLMFCLDRTCHVFHHGDPGEWKISPQLFEDVEFSFTSICKKCQNLLATGLWLSDFSFPHPDLSGFGVLLSIREVKDCDPNRLPIIIPRWYQDMHCFGKSYTVHAYSISKTSFLLEFYQQLDEVFSGILPPPTTPLTYWTLRSNLLDLGCIDHDQPNVRRRICAILTANGLTDNITYLLVSIFDLQMINSMRDSSYSCGVKEFLEVSVVKKQIFRLYDQGSSIHSFDDDSYEDWMSAYDIPPLHPFIL